MWCSDVISCALRRGLAAFSPTYRMGYGVTALNSTSHRPSPVCPVKRPSTGAAKPTHLSTPLSATPSTAVAFLRRLTMVSSLISSLHKDFPEMIIPVWGSPQASPSTPRSFFPVAVADNAKSFFMEFSCANEPLGRIVIKVPDEAGQAGLEFESLVTGNEGFGYKGSRVYACCNNEWCLMGDLLYQEPPPKPRQINDWDPRMPKGPKVEEDEGGGGGPPYRQLYRGRRRVVRAQEQVIARQPDTRGSVVSVATDYDMDTRTWTFGPQIKICLSDSLLGSGHVLGTVTEGMEVAQQLSRMGGKGRDPETRITISNCGALELQPDPPR